MTPTEPAGEKAKCKAPECGAVIYWGIIYMSTPKEVSDGAV